MKHAKYLWLFLLLLTLGTAIPAWPQIFPSGNKVTITQGGNDATVGAAGALKMNLGEIGGTAQSGANVIDVANTALRVNVVAGGGAGGTSSTFGAAFPGTGTAAGFSDGTNMQGARVVDLDTGAGVVYGLIGNLVRRASGGPTEMIGQTTMALSLPVTLASDQANINVVVASALPTGANNIGDVDVLTLPALATGSNVIGKTVMATGCGTAVFSQALVAVPTVEAAATAVTSCVVSVNACNTNATAQTFSLKDNQGTPIIAVNAVSIPGNSCYLYQLGGGLFTSGIRWVAGGTGVTGTILAYQ